MLREHNEIARNNIVRPISQSDPLTAANTYSPTYKQCVEVTVDSRWWITRHISAQYSVKDHLGVVKYVSTCLLSVHAYGGMRGFECYCIASLLAAPSALKLVDSEGVRDVPNLPNRPASSPT